MPPARRSAARTTRGGSTNRASSAGTRRDVERAIKRLEKAIDDANAALKALGKDASTGAKSTYRDLGKILTVFRRDAQKTNRALMKDLEKLAGAAVAPAKAATRSGANSGGRSKRSQSSANKSASSRTGSSRSRSRSSSSHASSSNRASTSRRAS